MKTRRYLIVNKNGLHVTGTGTAIKIEITIEASKDSKVAHFVNRYDDNNYWILYRQKVGISRSTTFKGIRLD